MELLIYNLTWMLYNFFLAIVSVIFGWLMLKFENIIARLLCAVVWILFIPNSIYIITDMIHLPKQFVDVSGIAGFFLVAEYAILAVGGVIMYIYSIYPFEMELLETNWKHKKRYIVLSIFSLNFLISLGVIMGRVMRTNSWYALSEPLRVIQDAFSVLTSLELMMYVLIFTFICNTLYFTFKDLFFHSTLK